MSRSKQMKRGRERGLLDLPAIEKGDIIVWPVGASPLDIVLEPSGDVVMRYLVNKHGHWDWYIPRWYPKIFIPLELWDNPGLADEVVII